MKEFKLKKWEREILLHRIELTDALEECLGTYHNEENEGEFKGFPEEDLRLAIGNQLGAITAGKLGIVSGTLEAIEKEVLAELLEGCTFFAGSEEAVQCGEMSRGMDYRQRKAGESLEKMISGIAGREVLITWH